MRSAGASVKKRVALVIGSGAVKCAAALGLWKVLIREGIRLDMLVGCSGGSLFDTDQFPYVIAQGERAAEAQIPYLRRLLTATG